MDSALYDKYLRPFITFHDNDAKYISNIQIEKYLIENHLQGNREALVSFQAYYREINASRHVLQNYLDLLDKQFIETGPVNAVSVAPLSESPPPFKYQEFINSLKLKRYSRRTVDAYSSTLLQAHKWFFLNHKLQIHEIDREKAVAYFLYLTETRKSSYSLVRMNRFSIEYYFLHALGKPIDLSFMNHAKKDNPLPTVLTHSEITAVIKSIENIKHRLMISLLYSAGLRVGEVVNLRVKDVSLEELVITVRQGKGKKDRVTVFSDKLRPELEELMKGKGPRDFLFSSNYKDGARLSVRSVQKIFKRGLARSHIIRDASCHDLRHSFASHLLENGTDIRFIQQLLGHKNISTTTIYTKVSAPALKGIKSPF